MSREPRRRRPVTLAEQVLVVATIALVAFGVVMVYSASSGYALDVHGSSLFFLEREGAYAAAGLLALAVCARIDYRVIGKMSPMLVLASAVLLVAVLGAGVTVNGARRLVVKLGGGLLAGELFGQGPVGLVALEDAVAVAVEAQRDAVGGDHGVQSAEIADGIFGFELKVSGEDLASGIVLKADESQGRTATFEPVVTTGVGERHHAETGTGRASGTILRGRRRCGEATLALRKMRRTVSRLTARFFSVTKFFRQMRIVEALILAPSLGSKSTASGEGKAPKAWSVRDCRAVPSRNRADNGV